MGPSSAVLLLLAVAAADGGAEGSASEPSVEQPPAVNRKALFKVEPGTPRPGDLVLVTLFAEKKAKPSGILGGKALKFYGAGKAFRALSPLSVDLPVGPLELKLTPTKGAEPLITELEVVDPKFRHSELSVAKKFTSPPKSVKQQIADDKAAFAKAYDQPFSGPLFTRNFQWPRRAVVTAPFGDRRVFNGKLQSQHFGTDIDGKTGDDVAAANDGVVVMARECYASGNTVIVHHGIGLFTAYFHLSRIDVAEGDKLKQGGHVGLVGKTGRVTGPHLHWAVKVNGMYVDPESLLRLNFEQ